MIMKKKQNNTSLAAEIDLEDPSTRRTAQLIKALGHPVRLSILKLLCERDTCFCGDFTDVLPLAQSTVSQHLKALKESGLITGTSQGVRTCYCLDPVGIQDLRQTLDHLAGMFDATNLPDCC
jgi:predicted transcriptional regulator